MDIVYQICVLVECIHILLVDKITSLPLTRKDVLMLISGTCGYVTLPHKRSFSFFTKIKILRQGYYPRLYKWVQYNHCDPHRGETGRSDTQREANGSNLQAKMHRWFGNGGRGLQTRNAVIVQQLGVGRWLEWGGRARNEFSPLESPERRRACRLLD